MSGQPFQEAKDKFRALGMKLVDVIYSASVLSVVAYGAMLLFLLIIGLAIAFNMVTVPEFHPK